MIIAGRGLRASHLLVCAARAAIRAKRPCLYLQHMDGLGGRLALPPECEKHSYKSGTDAAAHAADFNARAIPAPVVRHTDGLRVFVLENGPSQWNMAINSAFDRADVRRLDCSDLRPRSVVRAAIDADATIVVPSGRNRRWHRETSHLMRLAMGACELLNKPCLHLHHHLIPRTSEDAPISKLKCESIVCVSHKAVDEAVRKFIHDAKADVGLA
ncbi:MAG: hypothetical protein JWP89_5198 [Schlesneria sp.]|nr:hypothetical protein [Schlesneria sp.]